MKSHPASYAIPVTLAVMLHLGVASLFLMEWHTPDPVKPIPVHMTARVITVENQAEAQKQRLEQQRQARLAVAQQQRAEQERLNKVKQQKAAEAAAKQAKKEAAELALKKAAAAKEAARKAAAEKARQAQEQKAREEQEARELAEIEQNLLEKLAQEEAEAELLRQQEAERRAKLAARIETEYLARIRDQISSAWVYPPGVDPEQEVDVELSLVPTGEVVNLTILNGSGNQAFDRSVEQAILNASPLPVPEDIRIFEASFRQFRMKFRPENATW